MPYSSSSSPSYKQECCDVAISYCSGQVYTAIAKICPEDMPSTTELTALMDECTDEVNDLVPPPTKPTPRPTRRPTRKPTTDKGSCARVPISDFCAAARHCCSSATKYNDHESFCTYYGFPPKDGDSLTTFSMFNYVDSGITVDCTQCAPLVLHMMTLTLTLRTLRQSLMIWRFGITSVYRDKGDELKTTI